MMMVDYGYGFFFGWYFEVWMVLSHGLMSGALVGC